MHEKTLQKLEYDRIVYQLAELTSTQLGYQMTKQLQPSTDYDTVVSSLTDTQDACDLLRLKQGLPIGQLADIRIPIKRITLDALLNLQELADILKVVVSTKQVIDFLNKAADEDIVLQQLYRFKNKLVDLKELRKKLLQVVSVDGTMNDDASEALKAIRHNMKRMQQNVREKMEQLLRQKQNQLTDALITMRFDRYVLPVKQEFKNTFKGVIHDQSASGTTVYIEPEEVVVLNNRLRELVAQEQAEIERILWEMTQELAPYTNELIHNHYQLAVLDMLNAKALYAKQLNAVKPRVSKDNYLSLLGARHPLIDAKKVVKNDIALGEEYQCIVITGPNTGGKTILLKTVGLLQLMAQSGLHIPVDEHSTIGVFANIFAEIGDEQSIENNLSTFSSHMTNTIDILNQLDNQTLVLFDELGSGTDPQEGAALAMAILDYIATIGSYVIATTHYPELKMYGYNREKTSNASMEFDAQTLQPTYKFLMHIPGRSNALDIAKRLGLEERIVTLAKSFIDTESQSLNDMITSLESMRQQVAKQQESTQEKLSQAKELFANLQAGKTYLDEQREKVLNKARRDANAIVEKAQQESEEIISQIRQMQLNQQNATVKEHEFIEKRTALQALKHEEQLKKNKVLQKAKRNKNLKVGDSVEVMSYGQRGIIEQKLSDNQYVVKMGLLKMKVDLTDLRLIDDTSKEQRYIPTLKGSRSKVTSQLDLRGYRYEDALVELDRYIDAAILSGYAQVTIVHGRGTGAVRDGVIKQLRKHKGVQSFEFAPINQGGNGATIVQFK